MNIKKAVLGSSMSLLTAGALFLTPAAFAGGPQFNVGYQMPSQSQFTFSSFSNPVQLDQTKQSFNASFASMFNTSTSYGQQFQVSATNDVTKLVQNLQSVFNQGMNSLGGFGL
jgi:hypothetical protein